MNYKNLIITLAVAMIPPMAFDTQASGMNPCQTEPNEYRAQDVRTRVYVVSNTDSLLYAPSLSASYEEHCAPMGDESESYWTLCLADQNKKRRAPDKDLSDELKFAASKQGK